MEAAGRTKEEIQADVPQVLEIVGLDGKENNFSHELSGGEKQRVAVARALVQRPEVILADEPTGNLDPIHTWEIMKLLVKINEFGTAIVLATHDKDVVNFLERRVITLQDGKLSRDEQKGKYRV
jgi:cell division transport system ATP-binding protein